MDKVDAAVSIFLLAMMVSIVIGFVIVPALYQKWKNSHSH